MNVLFVYKEDYPWDVRVEKIVDSLLADGHQVTLVARNLESRPARDRIGELEIIRLPRLPRATGPLRHLWNVPFFANPSWVFTIASALRTRDFDLVIVRDIPLSLTVLGLARVHGCRVILDMAECYPAMYSTLIELGNHPLLLRVAKNPDLARLQEKFTVDHCDHTLTVVDETRERLISLGHDAQRIAVVSNTPRFVDAIPVREHGPSTPLKLVYIGFVERIRGLDVALHGLQEFRRIAPDHEFELDVIGTGPARPELEQLSTTLELDDHVRFHGWLPHDRAFELLTQADAGLIPHVMCEAWDRTVSNKLFDYMAHGIPVISTYTRPTGRILKKTGSGLVFTDPPSLARVLLEISDPARRRVLGANGRRAVEELFHWPRDESKLLEVVNAC